jgi:hypothetical protein
MTCVLAIPAAYFDKTKKSLEAEIDRHIVSWLERETERDDEHLQTIPEAVLDNPKALQHQKCSIAIPNYTTSDQSAEHFTQLLRHLAYFCSWASAVIFFPSMDLKGYRRISEDKAFAEGELLCDSLRIRKRTPTRVEVSMEHARSYDSMARLLVMHLDVAASKGAVLILETLQWRSDGKGEDLLPDQAPWFLPREIEVAGFLFYGAEYLGTTIPMPQVEEEKLVDDGLVGAEYVEMIMPTPQVEEKKLDDDGFVMVHPVEKFAA